MSEHGNMPSAPLPSSGATMPVEWWAEREGGAVATKPFGTPKGSNWLAWHVKTVNKALGAVILENHWDEHDRNVQVVVDVGQVVVRDVEVPNN